MDDYAILGLYRKIVSYVLLCSGLGSPTDISVVREATGMYIRTIKFNEEICHVFIIFI